MIQCFRVKKGVKRMVAIEAREARKAGHAL